MLESRERLVSKAHHEKADEAKDHRVPVRQNPGVNNRAEVLLQPDSQQIKRTPKAPKCEHRADAGKKKRTIDRFGNRALRMRGWCGAVYSRVDHSIFSFPLERNPDTSGLPYL